MSEDKSYSCICPMLSLATIPLLYLCCNLPLLPWFKCFYEARVQQCGGAFEVDAAWRNDSRSSRPEDSTQVCLACAKGDLEDLLLMCDGECGRWCHTHCCDPPLDAVPDDDWFCPPCATERAKPVDSEQPAKFPKVTKSSASTSLRFDELVEQAMPSSSPLSEAALAIEPDVLGAQGDAAALAMAAVEKAATETKAAKQMFADEGSAKQKVRAGNATVARFVAETEVDQKRLAEKSAE